MIAKLTDPWFDAEFYGKADVRGGYTLQGGEVEGAQGLFLWCPCGFGKPEYPLNGGKPHGVIVPFANPRNAPQLPPNHGPHSARTGCSVAMAGRSDTCTDPSHHPRWHMEGTGLHDLTTTPSIAVGNPECWHGFITNGLVK